MNPRPRLGLACLLALGLLAALVLPARYSGAAAEPVRPLATATRDVPPAQQSICSGFVTATLSSHSIRLCDDVLVTTSLWPSCPLCPGGIHVVFVQIDVAEKADWMTSESIAALKQLESYRGQEMRVGVVHYNSQSVRQVQPMTDNLSRTLGALRGPQYGRDSHGDFLGAARMALDMLQDARKMHDAAAGSIGDKPCEFVVFFASSASSYPRDEANMREAGNMITRNGVTLMAGCPETNVGDYCRATKDLPNPKHYYTEFPDGGGRLRRYVIDEMDKLMRQSGLNSMSLWQSLPPGLQYIHGSASVTPTLAVQSDNSVRLKWDWIRLTRTEPHTVTYRVRPLAEGNWPMSGMVTMKDRDNKLRELPVPDLSLTVAGDCGVATPTNPPPSVTPVPTNTATPTDVPARTPWPIYLPAAAKDR